MPSPFPGMNPYFEQAGLWQDFHAEFLSAFRRALAPSVAPGYIVQLEEHIYIHDLPPGPRRPLGRADLPVAKPGVVGGGPARLAVLEPPTEVHLPDQEFERAAFLEVRDRRGRGLVAVIELLSPSNKRPGGDREQYLAKRRGLLGGGAHLIEIDLLRGWPHLPAEGWPGADYSVLVSRADRRPIADFWPIRLRDRLPIIPVPLKADDGDAPVDLQEVLDRTYDGPGYEHFIYGGSPDPPLLPGDVAWSLGFVPRPA